MKNRVLAETKNIRIGIDQAKENQENAVYLVPTPRNTYCSLAEYVMLCKANPDYVFMIIDQDRRLNLLDMYNRTISLDVAITHLSTFKNEYAILEAEYLNLKSTT